MIHPRRILSQTYLILHLLLDATTLHKIGQSIKKTSEKHKITQKNITFAVAMQSNCPLNINPATAAKEGKSLIFNLDDAFFNELEQEEIIGGNVVAELSIKEVTTHIYNVSVTVKGEVGVQCDRCLDELQLPVEASDTVKLKHGRPEEDDGDDWLYMSENKSAYDFGWTLYEIIETSLPLNRTHAEGQCNEAMLEYISREETLEEEE